MEGQNTVVRERIRTYLQRMYYNKYDESKYNKLLKNFPEVRPFEIDTDIPESMRSEFDNYDPTINYKKLIQYGDEFADNRDLYVDKHTRRLKAGIDPKYFDDRDVQNAQANTNNNEFNTDTRNNANKYNTNVEDDEEYTNENVEIERFDNMNSNQGGVNQANQVKNSSNQVSWDQHLMYGSFYTLIVFIII